MTVWEACELLKLYQYGNSEMPKHSFDLSDETVETLLDALEEGAGE